MYKSCILCILIVLLQLPCFGQGGGISGGNPRRDPFAYQDRNLNFIFSSPKIYFNPIIKGNTSLYKNFSQKRQVQITPIENVKCPIATMNSCIITLEANRALGLMKLRENQYIQIEVMTKIDGENVEKEFESVVQSIFVLK